MSHILEVLDNALLQGLTYGIAVGGVGVALRILRYPDLTGDGSFLIGACTFASLISNGVHWSFAYLLAAIIGSVAGLLTAGMHFVLGVNRLLTGILSTMILYSLSFRILGGRSNLGTTKVPNAFTWAESLDSRFAPADNFVHPVSVALSGLIALLVWLGISFLLRCDLGLLFRAIGGNARLAGSLGWSVPMLTTLGLVICNGLIGLTGALIASRQGFADVNMGTGVVIVLIAALIVGEEFARFARWDPSVGVFRRTTASFVGAVLYFFLYLVVLRASILGLLPFVIQPTDLRVLSALVLIVTIGLRALRGEHEEELFPI